MKTKQLSLLIAVVFLFGCTQTKLTRDKAKSQIIKKLNYPKDEKYSLAVEDKTMYQTMTISKWDKFKKLGLLTYEEFGKNPDRGTGWIPKVTIGGSGIRANLTKKGKKYVLSDIKVDGFEKKVDVKIAELKFVEITGIKIYKEFNSAEVEYKIKRKNITPFGKALNINESKIEKSISFTKYDDGWRIDR